MTLTAILVTAVLLSGISLIANMALYVALYDEKAEQEGSKDDASVLREKCANFAVYSWWAFLASLVALIIKWLLF